MDVNFLSHSGQMQSGCLFLSLKADEEVVLVVVVVVDRRDGAGVVLLVVGELLLDLAVDGLLSSLSSSGFLRKPRSSMS